MRKTKTVTIASGSPEDNRDHGKSFLIREMSAWDAERWAMKALLALGRAGVEVPDDAVQAGAAGIMAAGFSAFSRIAFDDAESLMDEMLGCIAFVPDLSRRDPVRSDLPMTRALMRGDAVNDGDIEEIATLLKLRMEVAELHVGFSIPAVLSSMAETWLASRPSPTPTSLEAAEPSSPIAEPA